MAMQNKAGETLIHDAALLAAVGGAGAATATIPFNPAANISNAIDVTNHFPGGFHVVAVPSSGYLSLSVSADAGAHYGLLNVDGAQVIIAAVAAKYYGLGSYAGSLQGITHIKFVNVDATGTAANQATADATIIVSRA